MILPKSTFVSSSEKALMASSSFSKVINPNPFVLPSYSFGSLTFVMFPYFSKDFLKSAYSRLYGRLVM